MIDLLPQLFFSDEIVKATDLNRKSGAVLSRAAHHPITIVRNDECFTLLRREDIARIVTEATQTKNVLEILKAAFLLSHNQALNDDNAYTWLQAFDKEEVQELVSEVSEAYRKDPHTTRGWENLEAAVHEWHEDCDRNPQSRLTSSLASTSQRRTSNRSC